MYDIFISYRRDGGYVMARLLYDRFKQMGLHPFFDLEELKSGQFDTKLYRHIEESSNFVLVLPANSLDRCVNEDDWLRLEIEHAIAHNKNIIPIMMSDFCWPESLPQSLATLPNYNGVRSSREYFDAAIDRLISMLVNVKLKSDAPAPKTARVLERTENTYFAYEDVKEKKRLKIQQNLMKQFDRDAYKKAVDSFDELYVLDIGSNNGDFVMDRIGKSDKVKLLVGLEYDRESVIAANEKYGIEGKIAFYEQNVEADDLEDRLFDILDRAGVEKFNLINISMVMLHLKNPYRLLKVIRPFLEKGGMIIIKDIDDGYNLAYPDPKGEFARVVEICAKNDTSGYRHSGRQIYTLLKHAGYIDVCLEQCGLSTVGMDYDERSALFDTYFSFIIEDLKIMIEAYPNDTEIRDDYEWYRKIYDDLEERFQDEAFYFNLGFVLYTARKR